MGLILQQAFCFGQFDMRQIDSIVSVIDTKRDLSKKCACDTGAAYGEDPQIDEPFTSICYDFYYTGYKLLKIEHTATRCYLMKKCNSCKSCLSADWEPISKTIFYFYNDSLIKVDDRDMTEYPYTIKQFYFKENDLVYLESILHKGTEKFKNTKHYIDFARELLADFNGTGRMSKFIK